MVTRNSSTVLVLVGPTASGKTAVGVELARLLNGEIISADSRQIYKHLTIGTAKPSAEQLRTVKHHFIDALLPHEQFTAGDFGVQGRKVIVEIFSRKKIPIVVGGSGLYIQSLIDGFFEGPPADWEFRARLEERLNQGGLHEVMDELRKVDPVSAQRIDPTKPRRIVRALEVFHVTGKPLSQLHAETKIKINFTCGLFGLEWERHALYERINRRSEEMLEGGLVQEVERLERLGFDSSLNALNTVGYAEAFAYRRGEIPSDEMVRLLKQNSRRYAKRQLTWFRRDKRIQWVKMSDSAVPREIAHRIALLFQNG